MILPSLGTIKIIVAVAGSVALLTTLVFIYRNWKDDIVNLASMETAKEHIDIAAGQKEDLANRKSVNEDFAKYLEEGRM